MGTRPDGAASDPLSKQETHEAYSVGPLLVQGRYNRRVLVVDGERWLSRIWTVLNGRALARWRAASGELVLR